MKRIFLYLIFIVFVIGIVGWIVTGPKRIDPALLSGIEADLARGEFVFNAAGCASCHMAKDASADSRLQLGGGQEFPSSFGTFVAPNISSHKTVGIGTWSSEDLANALLGGVSPDGRHYFPAFPYGTYNRMTPFDVVSLHAYLAGLPAVGRANEPHRISFPFNIRRSVGIWKA
ncbi:MAG: diacylglycerol kinase, partial [Amylibacter sp.]